MTLDLGFFAFAIPAVIFAGVSKGGFGSGAAFASTPLLALILTPGQAIGLMLPLLMLMDVTALKPYWRKWDRPSAGALILGAVPGIALAAAVYHLMDPHLFKLLIGLVALGFVAWQAVRRLGFYNPAAHHLSIGAGRVAGVVVGVTSFISHAGGPPAAVFLLTRGLDKTAYQATTVITFWAVNLLKFIPYLFLGIFTWDTAKADLYLFPFAVLGVWLGVMAHRRFSDRAYFAVTYVLLTVTGAKLVWDALA